MQLEVLDLEICHFVQYRPPNPPFEPMELNVTIVHRDRAWFEINLPLFQKFISDLDRLKMDLNTIGDQYAIESKNPPKKRIKTENKNKDVPCLIQNEITPLPKSLIIDDELV
tara:strand:- start:756 stop:1091 length:336 start_codon:yes stop_codon:yes gene_type:complete